MDTEFLAALDDVDGHKNEAPMTTQAFSLPSLSSSQFKQLELLQHLSLYSELLILVCAEKGMGKTFIAKALFATREVPDQSLMLEADFSLSYLDILHNLAQFLDLADLADDIDGIEQQILAQCLQISEEDQGSVLLIIDQAEQLTDDVLADINQLALLVPSALHIMLLAPLGFENKLLALDEPQAPFHMMDIEPLAEDEAEILLLEQFPEKEWEAEQADYIVRQSAGNPGKILYLAQQLIIGVKPSQEAVSASTFPITHAAAIAAVAFVLIGAYFYQSSSTPLNTELVLDSEAVTFEAAIVKEALVLEVPKNVLANSGSIETEEEVDFNFPKADAAKFASVPEPLSDESIASTVVASESELSKAVAVKEPVIIYSTDEQVLMSVSSDAFVIQLFGSHSADNAHVFINENATKTLKLLKYQTQYKDKPWHVVIAGPYDSRAIALEQSKTLSAKLRNQKPWIRPISAIQSVLSTKNSSKTEQ